VRYEREDPGHQAKPQIAFVYRWRGVLHPQIPSHGEGQHSFPSYTRRSERIVTRTVSSIYTNQGCTRTSGTTRSRHRMLGRRTGGRCEWYPVHGQCYCLVFDMSNKAGQEYMINQRCPLSHHPPHIRIHIGAGYSLLGDTCSMCTGMKVGIRARHARVFVDMCVYMCVVVCMGLRIVSCIYVLPCSHTKYIQSSWNRHPRRGSPAGVC
jgi:hypothetical protein